MVIEERLLTGITNQLAVGSVNSSMAHCTFLVVITIFFC